MRMFQVVTNAIDGAIPGNPLEWMEAHLRSAHVGFMRKLGHCWWMKVLVVSMRGSPLAMASLGRPNFLESSLLVSLIIVPKFPTI